EVLLWLRARGDRRIARHLGDHQQAGVAGRQAVAPARAEPEIVEGRRPSGVSRVSVESFPGGRTVTPERWRQVKAVLDGALERRPAERAAFVATACADDSELRRE